MPETKTRMQTPAIIPIVQFRHGTRSIDWLCEAFGFERSAVYADDDGHVHHAELALGRQLIMGGSESGEGEFKKLAHPAGQAMLYVALDGGLEAHLERARAAGAEIVMELSEKDYGGADYTARDPEGNLWTFGTYVPEVPA
ncbi:VOC family protein [Conexibacter arvalis]|uniref:Putative glyoxalase superfamily protein PhnB n=1 Tax=Conexibacter arvalis TaxID=912552 RepID=A0A840IFT3_9ACTN|nr:VOC family protein [Conexibacter arvalis]MBB4663053.1 putative glyoxalase superfamily protein PhnB [Conexibacter arvalis]